MKRWFLISELRAANVPTFTESFLQELYDAHPDLAADQVRACQFTGTFSYRPEFNIGLFTRAERQRLFRHYRAELDRP